MCACEVSFRSRNLLGLCPCQSQGDIDVTVKFYEFDLGITVVGVFSCSPAVFLLTFWYLKSFWLFG
jgi:hypothetical protein